MRQALAEDLSCQFCHDTKRYHRPLTCSIWLLSRLLHIFFTRQRDAEGGYPWLRKGRVAENQKHTFDACSPNNESTSMPSKRLPTMTAPANSSSNMKADLPPVHLSDQACLPVAVPRLRKEGRIPLRRLSKARQQKVRPLNSTLPPPMTPLAFLDISLA